MKVYYLLITSILWIIIFNGGCNVNQPEDKNTPEFESGFFYETSADKINLFRINSMVAVIFDSSITSEKVKYIVQTYHLEPIKMFADTDYGDNWDRIIEDDIILMKLPEGAELEDYVSTFPLNTNQKFGDIEEVKFCLPVFAFDASGDPKSRFIINDEIILSSNKDSVTTLAILDSYNLVFIRKTAWSEYTLRLSHDSPANSLAISNSLYNYSEFNWSMPNGYAYINNWP